MPIDDKLGPIEGTSGGGAWKKYTAAEVLGSEAASLLGMFGGSASKQAAAKPKEVEEAEMQELRARSFGGLHWRLEGVPAPDFVVIEDEIGPSYRAEISIFVQQDSLKEVRLLGPRRAAVEEARKDGNDVRRIAFKTAQKDPTLLEVCRRCHELESVQWPAAVLVGEDIQQTSEQKLPAVRSRPPGKRDNYATAAEWFHANNAKEDLTEQFTAVGPHWALCKVQTPVPILPGIWYVHERQDQEGKHSPALFFNASTGKYYRNRIKEGSYNHETSRWVQTGIPHQPQDHFMLVSHGSACLPGASGRKDAMAVTLPELARTGALLKLPLPFADKPASLFLLVDGLRNCSIAAEWCAKRFHTHFLPRLAACHSDPEDFELTSMVRESLEHLDHALLESAARYAGCSLAVALLLGCRLLICTLGACRAVICSPPDESSVEAPAAKRPAKQATAKWHVRTLNGNVPGHTMAEVQMAERKRRIDAYAPLDFEGKPGQQLTAASMSIEAVASESLSDQDRVLKQALRAAHPFAALGMTRAEAMAALPGAGMTAATAVQTQLGLFSGKLLLQQAWNRVKHAGETVDKMLSQDQYGAQQLAALCYTMDEEDGIMSPQRAATLLGVEPGCGEAAARSAVEFRYRAALGGLDAACPADAARGWHILREVIDAAARPTTTIWTPPIGSRGVDVARAMGLRHLKQPRKLVGVEFVSELIRLKPGTTSCLMLLTSGARAISQEQIEAAVSRNVSRPKAACLHLVSSVAATQEAGAGSSASSSSTEVPSVGALSAFFTVAGTTKLGSADPKKRKASGESESVLPFERPKKVRIAHLLLKCESMSGPDSQARRPAPKGRTQADAEQILLKLLHTLDEISQGPQDSVRKTTAKFGELCKQHSDCKSASGNGDLGFVTQGQIKEFDSIAFDLPVGGVSDIFATPRGVHILHRLA
eukprot:TRINITY_DN42511_c0_g1_i1.p1 TRINITY_DN42511_c0_g1~~TRINITY_DN42511_c0_g1_i1.p1  ORF type:complete len:936 (-),score=162.22 TRINITY_DN42511_c0_g1_i1:359-3166(-)